MKPILVIAALTLAVSPLALSQGKPNFSGVWKLQSTQGTEVLKIDHQEPKIHSWSPPGTSPQALADLATDQRIGARTGIAPGTGLGDRRSEGGKPCRGRQPPSPRNTKGIMSTSSVASTLGRNGSYPQIRRGDIGGVSEAACPAAWDWSPTARERIRAAARRPRLPTRHR
jgi:hypothetical protein